MIEEMWNILSNENVYLSKEEKRSVMLPVKS